MLFILTFPTISAPLLRPWGEMEKMVPSQSTSRPALDILIQAAGCFNLFFEKMLRMQTDSKILYLFLHAKNTFFYIINLTIKSKTEKENEKIPES